MRFFPLIILCITLTSCTTRQQPRVEQFLPYEYEPYSKPGTATIVGDVFLVTKSGEVKKGAGFPIILTPVTSYSTEWFQRGVLNKAPLDAQDERLRSFQQEVIADGDGRFEFENLPAGNYYLVSKVLWEDPPAHWYSGVRKMGDTVHAKVSVKPGERKKVALTQPR